MTRNTPPGISYERLQENNYCHINPWVEVKLVPHWELNILYIKRSQLLCRKKISLLTGLQVPSLTCKYIFYRPEHYAKGEPQGIGVICLVIMFNTRVMVIKISKMANFLMTAKNQSVFAKYLNISERSYLDLSENARDYWVLSYH